ncbi:MAG: sigma-70 family RNA polymerase sigma factor [Eggerthellaceae bacterium]|nr:sigma-70 family RNA polymerase sigma factor [Eggerthellaceae bacterium]
MKKINLRELYPKYYQSDIIFEVTDEIVRAIEEFDLLEVAYLRRLYRNRAHYSLDAGDGIENHTLLRVLSPHEEYERKEEMRALYCAIHALPNKQRERIYAHFFLGLSKAEIARAEGINARSVSESIERALRNLEKALRKKL